MDKAPYLIIGNSVAAMGAIAGIRSIDANRPITLIAKESEHTYSRPLIPYLLAGKVDEKRMHYRPKDFYERNNVRVMLGVEVRRVDAQAKSVETSDGQTIAFDQLLIATGGKPILPADVSGNEAKGVFTFATWEDAREIRDFIGANGVKEAVVVGGGLIGLKSMEALHALAVRTTIVELADRILSATFDKKASDMSRAHLEEAGISVRCGTTVAGIQQQEGKVSGVTLRDGTKIPCGLVIFAIGVVPDARIVADTPIKMDRGILVDERLQSSIDGIYAAGDVSQGADLLTGQMRPIPIFPNAYRQGFVAGCNMAGSDRRYKGGMAMNSVDVLGLPTISVGITSPEGEGYEALSAFDPEEPSYKKIVLKNDRIVGAIFIGQIDRAGIITGLIKDAVDVSSFKDLLLTEAFGLISLPQEYRKHIVKGTGIEV